MNRNLSWDALLNCANNPAALKIVFKNFNGNEFVRRAQKDCSFDCSLSDVVQALLVSAAEHHTLFSHLLNAFAVQTPKLLPCFETILNELLTHPYNPSEAIKHVIAHSNLFPHSEIPQSPLLTALFVGDLNAANLLIEAIPSYFDPIAITRSVLLSEDEMSLQWLLYHPQMQCLSNEYYAQSLALACTDFSQTSLNFVTKLKQKIVQALSELLHTGKLCFAFAHRTCVLQAHASDDLAHLLWVCGKQGGAVMLDCLEQVIHIPSYFTLMMRNGDYKQADLCQKYVKNEDFDGLLPLIGDKMVDKMQETPTLYARFSRQKIQCAVNEHWQSAPTRMVRRM